MPRVSYLVPVYNGAATLPTALRSILAQRDVELEAVVVDDGSTDETAHILARFATDDARVRPLRIAHGGIVAALNAGLHQCAGALIARLDADDVALPERTRRQVEALDAHPDWVAVGCGVRLADGDPADPRDEHAGMRRYLAWVNSLLSPEDIAAARFVESPIVHTSALIRADALRGIGGYRSAPSPEDYDLWLRLLGAGRRIGKLPDVLVAIGDAPHRLTRTHPTCSRDAFWECRIVHLLEGPLAGHPHALVYGAGTTGKRLLRDLAARGCPASHVGDGNPRRHGARIHGALVVSRDALGAVRDALTDPPPIVVAVAAHDARDALRHWAVARGWREGHEIFFLAGVT